jgi:hypothetical protein
MLTTTITRIAVRPMFMPKPKSLQETMFGNFVAFDMIGHQIVSSVLIETRGRRN